MTIIKKDLDEKSRLSGIAGKETVKGVNKWDVLKG